MTTITQCVLVGKGFNEKSTKITLAKSFSLSLAGPFTTRLEVAQISRPRGCTLTRLAAQFPRGSFHYQARARTDLEAQRLHAHTPCGTIPLRVLPLPGSSSEARARSRACAFALSPSRVLSLAGPLPCGALLRGSHFLSAAASLHSTFPCWSRAVFAEVGRRARL